jgi:hypothetical protein
MLTLTVIVAAIVLAAGLAKAWNRAANAVARKPQAELAAQAAR